MDGYIQVKVSTLKKVAIADAIGWVIMISAIVYLVVT